ncbi:unnamed protein product [Schistosoma rodhaini]|nr:unnamed protein product [Schistosoma rodhaini]
MTSKKKTSTSRWTTHKSSSTTFDTRNDYNSNLSITVSLHHTNSQHDGRVSPFIAKVAHLGSLSHGSHGHNDNHFSHSKQTQPIIQLTSTSRWTTHKSSSTTFDTRNDYNSNLSITVSLHHTNSQHDGRVSPFIAKVAHLGSLSHGSHGHNDNHFSHSKQTQPIIQLSVSPVDSVSDALSKALVDHLR